MSFLRASVAASLLALSLSASPLLPASALGAAKTVQITNDRQLLVLSGGRYNGLVDGADVDLWCVDVERFASKGNTYTANVIPLDSWTPEEAALVRKGNYSNQDFWWDLGLGAVERYQAAAWLITQMEAYRSGTPFLPDLHIQQAVWGILDDAENQSISLTPLAQAWMRTAAVVIRENPGFGFGEWAVISGNAAADGSFQGWQYQTFLARLESVAPAARFGAGPEPAPLTENPEPGTFALIGAGLLAGGMAARRRR
jgi:hypothetical protein